jgi:hypothetical protein
MIGTLANCRLRTKPGLEEPPNNGNTNSGNGNPNRRDVATPNSAPPASIPIFDRVGRLATWPDPINTTTTRQQAIRSAAVCT